MVVTRFSFGAIAGKALSPHLREDWAYLHTSICQHERQIRVTSDRPHAWAFITAFLWPILPARFWYDDNYGSNSARVNSILSFEPTYGFSGVAMMFNDSAPITFAESKLAISAACHAIYAYAIYAWYVERIPAHTIAFSLDITNGEPRQSFDSHLSTSSFAFDLSQHLMTRTVWAPALHFSHAQFSIYHRSTFII